MKETKNIHHRKIKTQNLHTENKSFGFIKTSIFLFLIMLQIVFLILSYLTIFSTFKHFLTISAILSVLTSLYILSSNKNTHSKAVWILFVLVNYSFAYLFYWASHEKLLFRNIKKRYKKINENAKDQIVKQDVLNNQCCNMLYQTENFPTSTNNSIRYHNNGNDYFNSILNTLRSAKKYIFMEFYIISNGSLWKQMIEIFEQKLKEGVDIRIIYDSFGSHKCLPSKQKKLLRNMGIKLYSFNKFTPKFSIILNFRNHRKIVVVDGKTAFTGGANIGDEYTNKTSPYGYWKDCGVKISGPAVNSFLLMFLKQWEFVTKTPVNYSEFLPTPNSNNIITNLNLTQNATNSSHPQSLLTPYCDGLNNNTDVVKNLFSNIITNAKEKIYIATPYFIPDNTLIDLLKAKALAGLDVRILLPDIPDKKMVYIVSVNNAEKLLDSGVKIYCLKNSFVHSKIVANESEFTLGTANFDLRSFYQQFECGIYSNCTKTTNTILEDFTDCFNNSNQITKSNMKRKRLRFRIASGLLQIISPFM